MVQNTENFPSFPVICTCLEKKGCENLLHVDFTWRVYDSAYSDFHSILLATSNSAFLHTKSAPATSQPIVFYSHSKSAPATNHSQPNKMNSKFITDEQTTHTSLNFRFPKPFTSLNFCHKLKPSSLEISRKQFYDLFSVTWLTS